MLSINCLMKLVITLWIMLSNWLNLVCSLYMFWITSTGKRRPMMSGRIVRTRVFMLWLQVLCFVAFQKLIYQMIVAFQKLIYQMIVVKLSSSGKNAIRCRYRILLAQILFEHFPELCVFKPHISAHTECLFSEKASMKSEVITLPVLMKDEKKYADCVDVLDQLEKWTQKLYSDAGLCSIPSPTGNTDQPAIGNRSRPDQPASHVHPVPSCDDPLSGIKIPCYGDQLTRVRLAGAKDLWAGCHSAAERLDHLYPFCIVDWHTKRSFLKVTIIRLPYIVHSEIFCPILI